MTRPSEVSSAIHVSNRQKKVPVDLAGLQRFAEAALHQCLKLRERKGGLTILSQLHVVLVSDRRMAQLHHRFFAVSGPTDVITFQHGEIIVSTETAHRQAKAFGGTTTDELRLYIVHGILHLDGFDDKKRADAMEMKRVQEKIVRLVSKEIGLK